MTSEALYYAVWRNDVTFAKKLIKEGADFNYENAYGRTTLHIAAEQGIKEVVELAIKKQSDINKVDFQGSTPLNGAAFNGHSEVVKLLIQVKSDINKASNTGFFSVFYLMILCNVKVVKTPLYHAANKGFKETVKLLVQAGADVNKINYLGWTPLKSSASEGHPEVVELLLKAGADVNKATKEGWTPLKSSASKGHPEVVQLLLKAGADANKADSKGWTPLNISASEGHPEVVELLLKAGADANKADSKGVTPLQVSANEGHPKVVELLLKAGADANKAESKGVTPLQVSASKGHSKVVELLLKAGADANKAESKGRTPLMTAAQHGHVPIARLLLHHGAELEVKSKGGITALAHASYKGKQEMVDFLIKQGAQHEHLKEIEITAQGSHDIEVKKNVQEILTRPELKFIQGTDDTSVLWTETERKSLVKGYNTRFLTAGEVKSGKTSLTRTFLSKTQYRAYENDRTVVVEQRQWSTSNGVIPIVDLGGHQSYRVTAAFFMTNSVNTIVALCNEITNNDYRTTYSWIKDIISLAPKSHIIPILTKSDQLPQKEHQNAKEKFTTEINKYIEEDIKILKKKQSSSHNPKKVTEIVEKYEKLKQGLDSLTHIVSTAPLQQGSVERLKKTILNWTEKPVDLPEVYQRFYVRIGKLGAKMTDTRGIAQGEQWPRHSVHDLTEKQIEIQSPRHSVDDQATAELEVQSPRHSKDYQATGELQFPKCSIGDQATEEVQVQSLIHYTQGNKQDIKSIQHPRNYDSTGEPEMQSHQQSRYKVSEEPGVQLFPEQRQSHITEVAQYTSSHKKEVQKSKFKKFKTWMTSRVVSKFAGKSKKHHFDESATQSLEYDIAKNESEIVSSQQFPTATTLHPGRSQKHFPLEELEIQSPKHSQDVRGKDELEILFPGRGADDRLEQQLETLTIDSNIITQKKYLTLEEAKQIFNEVQKTYDQKEGRKVYDVRRCLSVLHQLGLLYWYQGSEVLEHYVFNNPTTLVLILRSIFHHDLDDKLCFTKLSIKQKDFFQNDESIFEKNVEMLQSKGILTKAMVLTLLDINDCDINGDFVADLLSHTNVAYRFLVPTEDDPFLFLPYFIEDLVISKAMIEIATKIKITTANKISLQVYIDGNLTQNHFNRIMVKLYEQFYLVKDQEIKQEVWGQGIWMILGTFQLFITFNGTSQIEICLQGEENDLPEMWRYIRYVHVESKKLQQDWTPGMVTQSTISCIICDYYRTRLKASCQLDLEEILECPGGRYTCKTTRETIPTAFVTPLDERNKECATVLEEIRKFIRKEGKTPKVLKKYWERRALETMHVDPVIDYLHEDEAIELEDVHELGLERMTAFSKIEFILEKVGERQLIQALQKTKYHTNITLAKLILADFTGGDMLQVEKEYLSDVQIKALTGKFRREFVSKVSIDALQVQLFQNETLDTNYRYDEVRQRQSAVKKAQYLINHVLLRGTRATVEKFKEALIATQQHELLEVLNQCL